MSRNIYGSERVVKVSRHVFLDAAHSPAKYARWLASELTADGFPGEGRDLETVADAYERFENALREIVTAEADGMAGYDFSRRLRNIAEEALRAQVAAGVSGAD